MVLESTFGFRETVVEPGPGQSFGDRELGWTSAVEIVEFNSKRRDLGERDSTTSIERDRRDQGRESFESLLLGGDACEGSTQRLDSAGSPFPEKSSAAVGALGMDSGLSW